MLEGLASEFRVVIALFAGERLPAHSREARAPLAENVRYVLSLADEYLKSVPAPQRSMPDARRAFLTDGFDRLGQRPVAFNEDSFALISGPVAARLAVSVVDSWSDRDHEDYLILVHSFPLPWWRRIRTRVILGAIEHGIALPPRLQAVALAQGVAPNRRELWGRVLASAIDVAERRKPNDFDPEGRPTTGTWCSRSARRCRCPSSAGRSSWRRPRPRGCQPTAPAGGSRSVPRSARRP